MDKLTQIEKFVCELTWGGYPVKQEDIIWAKNSQLYKATLDKFNKGEYSMLWNYYKNK